LDKGLGENESAGPTAGWEATDQSKLTWVIQVRISFKCPGFLWEGYNQVHRRPAANVSRFSEAKYLLVGILFYGAGFCCGEESAAWRREGGASALLSLGERGRAIYIYGRKVEAGKSRAICEAVTVTQFSQVNTKL